MLYLKTRRLVLSDVWENTKNQKDTYLKKSTNWWLSMLRRIKRSVPFTMQILMEPRIVIDVLILATVQVNIDQLHQKAKLSFDCFWTISAEK